MAQTILTGWEEKTLGEICVIIAGQSPNSQFYNTEANGLPFYQGKKEFTNKYIGTPSVWTTETTKEALPGDILMSVRAPVGPINYATERCCIGRGLASIRNGELISKDFLFYYLLSIQQKIGGHDGAVFNSISRNEISALKILLPSLSEQERIVAKLDKAFEAIDKVKANAEKNLTNTKELFESALSNIFINLNFKPIKLCELADVNSGYAFKSNSFTEKGEYQVLRLGNVKQGFLRLSSNPVYVNNMTKDILEKSLLSKGDAVITQTGTKNKRDYGFVAIVDKDDLLLNQRLAMVKFKEKLLPQYFYYYSYTNTYKDDFFANEGGAVGQGNIGLNDIKNLTIPYVSLSEQQKIVEKLDALQEQTKQLEAIYTQKIKECDELKQSILQKAFRGEL